jgi:hypothetical protein
MSFYIFMLCSFYDVRSSIKIFLHLIFGNINRKLLKFIKDH